MIEKIYKENIKQFYYDEKYNFKGTYIGEFYHGVCIDFSLFLKRKYNELDINTYLIATKTNESNHAALIYLVDDEIYVADPITDARIMTNKNMSFDERNDFINNNKLQININLQDYIKENGTITIFNNNMQPIYRGNEISEIKEIIKQKPPHIGSK